MSADVVAIPGITPEALKPEVNQELVAYLEKLLGEARSGVAKGAIIASCVGDEFVGVELAETNQDACALWGFLGHYRIALSDLKELQG